MRRESVQVVPLTASMTSLAGLGSESKANKSSLMEMLLYMLESFTNYSLYRGQYIRTDGIILHTQQHWLTQCLASHFVSSTEYSPATTLIYKFICDRFGNIQYLVTQVRKMSIKFVCVC